MTQNIVADIAIELLIARDSDIAIKIRYKRARIRWPKYKEGNNRPSSGNQKSLVHKHDKAQAIVSVIGVLNIVLKPYISFRTIFRTQMTETIACVTKPGINVTLKTTRTLGETQVCEKVPGKSKLRMLWSCTRRGIKNITSHHNRSLWTTSIL